MCQWESSKKETKKKLVYKKNKEIVNWLSKLKYIEEPVDILFYKADLNN